MTGSFLRNVTGLALSVGLGLGMMTSAIAETTKARFAVDGFVLGTLIRVAEAKGYLAEEGIDPTLLTFSYGVDTVDAVLAGQADFGVIIDMPLLARLSSDKLSVPALIGTPNPGWHKLYVSTDYSGPESLAGKKIAVAKGTAQEFITRTHLSDNGLNPDEDVELVGFGSLFEIIGAMKAGRVDAAWIWGQGVEQISDDDRYRFEADDSIVNQKTTALLVVSKEYLENNRDAVVATLKALDKAGAAVAADIDEVADIVAKGIAGDATKVKPVILGQNYSLSFEQSAMDSLKAKYGFLIESGVIDPPYDFAAQFDLGVLKEVAPEAPTVDSLD